MKFSNGLNKRVPRDSGAAIRLGETEDITGEETRAGLFLVVFMRVLAGIWVIQGLLQWGAILMPPESLLDNVNALHGAAVIFFAIFDLVAAVGLWLAAPWGGIIWLLGAIAQIAVAVFLPGFFSMFWVVADIVLIALYFVLTWQAATRAQR
jgi:hypothetical protein